MRKQQAIAAQALATQLTYKLIDVLAETPGDIALNALVSATITVIANVSSGDGQQVADEVGRQISSQYEAASLLLKRHSIN